MSLILLGITSVCYSFCVQKHLPVCYHKNLNVKGVFIWEIEHKIPLYADDTEIMLKGDQESSEKKRKASGLFSNAGKPYGLAVDKLHLLNISTFQNGMEPI